MSKRLLPHIENREQYRLNFIENQIWEPAINFLSQKHRLVGQPERGILGSHIVYRVGNHWIKLMAPLFSQDMPFEVAGLKCLKNRLTVPIPEILGEGNLEGWEYIILNHLNGESIRNVWMALPSQKKDHLIDQIAETILQIRRCPADPIVQSRFEWNSFITLQFTDCQKNQKMKQFPEAWIKHFPEFLNGVGLDSFLCAVPCFLHSDLTGDHFLINEVGNLTGLIDLADCQTGHPEYELLAPAIFIFKSDRKSLQRFLLKCGYTTQDFNRKFSERLLAWSFLHRYCGLISYFPNEIAQTKVGDFSTLAEVIFPL